MERLKELASRFLFPIILTLIGIWMIAYGKNNQQVQDFLIGGWVVLGVGVLVLIYSLGFITRIVHLILIWLLFAGVIWMGYRNYEVVNDELKGRKLQKRMRKITVQGLKDIREVEVAYQERYGKYASSFDSLLHFLRHDSIAFVKVTGDRPDSLTEKQAIEKGFLNRDTLYTPVKDSLFNQDQKQAVLRGDRIYPFRVDSLPYKRKIQERFILKAGEVDQGGVSRPVFMAKDPSPYIVQPDGDTIKVQNAKGEVLQVGDMNEPSKSGNWGGY